MQGYSGDRCQFTHAYCDSSPCQNQATCVPTSSSFYCSCLPGTAGDLCEFDTVDDCLSSPCRHGGTCLDRPGGHECRCPPLWNGPSCDTFDDGFEGGIGHPVTTPRPVVHPDVAECVRNGCSEKAGNGQCDVSWCLLPMGVSVAQWLGRQTSDRAVVVRFPVRALLGN